VAPISSYNGPNVVTNLIPGITHGFDGCVLNALEVTRRIRAAIQELAKLVAVNLHVIQSTEVEATWVRFHDGLMEQTLAAGRNLTSPKTHP
jgi:hypothetical protein